MEIKQIIKEFEKNKLEHLERARMIITVGEPSIGCDVEEIVIDNDERMNLVSWFLSVYYLMEVNIKNYKDYSKPSNYDKETIEMIQEQIQYNNQQYNLVVEKLLTFGNEVEKDVP